MRTARLAILLVVLSAAPALAEGLHFRGSHSGNQVTLTQLPSGKWEVTIIRAEGQPGHLPPREELTRSDSETHNGWLGANVMIYEDKKSGEWTISYLPGFPTQKEFLIPVAPED